MTYRRVFVFIVELGVVFVKTMLFEVCWLKFESFFFNVHMKSLALKIFYL